jgi:hypothetical protein
LISYLNQKIFFQKENTHFHEDCSIETTPIKVNVDETASFKDLNEENQDNLKIAQNQMQVALISEKNYSYSLNDVYESNDIDSNPSASFSSSCEFKPQSHSYVVNTNTELGSLNSFNDFYSQFFCEHPPCESERTTGVIKEFRNLFLENYLQKNNVGRKSKQSHKSKSKIDLF